MTEQEDLESNLEIEEMETLRVKALEDQDSERYATYCDELGLSGSNIEDPYLYERAFVERNSEILAETLYQEYAEGNEPESKPKSKKPKIPKNQDLCDILYSEAGKKGIIVDNLFKDIEEKRSALKNIMGYNSLRGQESLEEASDQAVAKVYKRCYYDSKHAKKDN